MKKIKFMTLLVLASTQWFVISDLCFAKSNSMNSSGFKEPTHVTNSNNFINSSNFLNEPIFSPYIGAELGARVMPFKKGYGDNLTRSVYPLADVFVGLKISDCIGMEVGIETTQPQKRSVLLLGRDSYFGNILDPENPRLFYSFETKTQIRGYYASLLGFYAICDDQLLDIFGSIGLSNSKVKITHTIREVASVTLPTPIIRTLSQNKTLLRLTLGLQSVFCDGWGLRGSLGFKNTAQFKNLRPKESASSTIRASLQNSAVFRLGVFYQFN